MIFFQKSILEKKIDNCPFFLFKKYNKIYYIIKTQCNTSCSAERPRFDSFYFLAKTPSRKEYLSMLQYAPCLS